MSVFRTGQQRMRWIASLTHWEIMKDREASGHPFLLLPSIFPSIRVFSHESVLPIRWPKYWIFSLSISPSNEYSGLISFRMDWLDFFAVQGTLKSLLIPIIYSCLFLSTTMKLGGGHTIHPIIARYSPYVNYFTTILSLLLYYHRLN